MDKLLALYNELNDSGIFFFTWDLDDQKAGTIEIDGKYAIFMDMDNIRDTSEELVVVGHEGGHVSTGATHRLSSPYDLIEKHEYKAWKWAYKKLVPKDELDEMVASGCTEPWDLAEHFHVTEEFLVKAITYYKIQDGVA